MKQHDNDTIIKDYGIVDEGPIVSEEDLFEIETEKENYGSNEL